ncbi:uncharacterized protein METZ01_LOCUS226350, partial [marine metagenome]
MFNKLIQFSIKQRLLVIVATIFMGIWGAYNFLILPIDAVPDITNVQVQINTEAPGFTPLEVEQRITFPVETVIAGLPKLKNTRSLSRYGLSQVTAIFEDGTDIYFARQLISSRLQGVKEVLPENTEPLIGPIATGLGEIFMWSVERQDNSSNKNQEPSSLMELREVQDWIIRPQLFNVPGVTEVNSIGGYVKQYQVAPDPMKMIAFGVNFRDLMEALIKNNSNTGAGYIERQGEQYLIRSPGQVKGLQDIRKILLGSHDGVPIYVKDVAEVKLGKDLRTGAATINGKEAVLGTVFMLKGENSRSVSLRVAEKMKEIN